MKMVETNRPKPLLDVATTVVDTTSSQQLQQRQPHRPLQQLAQRHNKTVHFETDVTSIAKATTNSVIVPSLPDQFDKHVQQMFTFFGSALSVRHDHLCNDDEDDDNTDNDHLCSDDDYHNCSGDDDNDEDVSDDINSDSVSEDDAYYYERGGFYGDGGFDGDDDEDKRSVSDNETVRRKSSHHRHCRTLATMPFMYGVRAISFERDIGKGNLPFMHTHCKTTAGTCNKVFLEKVTATVVNGMSTHSFEGVFLVKG